MGGRTYVLSLALMLAACQSGPTRAPVKPKTTTAPVASADHARVLATSAPAVATGALQRPGGTVRELAGTVQLDAQYAVAHGGASVIANNAGNVLQLGAASALPAGSNLIAGNTGNLIAGNTGNLIAGNTGNLLGDNGGGYRLMAAGAPDYGTVLPASGVRVAIEDLATSELLTLGVDAQGQPARVILTDPDGAFRLYVPAGATGSLRLIAAPRDGADPRLHTERLTTPEATQASLDEDANQVANDVRQEIVAQMLRDFSSTDADAKIDVTLVNALAKDEADEIAKGIQTLLDAEHEAGLGQLPQDQQLAIANRLSDVLLSGMQLDAIPSLPSSVMASLALKSAHYDDGGTPEKATAVFQDVFSKMRAQVGLVMAREAAAGNDPQAYFQAKPYVQEAAERDGVAYAFEKPADAVDFGVRAVFANPNLSLLDVAVTAVTIFADKDIRLDSSQAPRMWLAQNGINLAFLRRAYVGERSALPELLAIVKAQGKAP